MREKLIDTHKLPSLFCSFLKTFFLVFSSYSFWPKSRFSVSPISHQDHLTALARWSGGRGRVTCVDTPSLLLSPEQLHSSSGGLSTLLQGPSTVAAEGQQCVSLSPLRLSLLEYAFKTAAWLPSYCAPSVIHS